MKAALMGTESSQAGKMWLCADLSLLGYQEARDLQVDLVAARKSRLVPADTLLLLEHPPVFTTGRQGRLENLRVPEAFIEESGIPIVHVERGGDITFHGPGQLVGYPIVDLHAGQWGVAGYVERLEEVMIRTAAHWGIRADRSPVNHGVWVGDRKLGSIGIAIRHGISFHGLAFNVNISLEPFGWINPCGLQGVEITSLERELSRTLPMGAVREKMKHSFEAVFKVRLAPTDIASLHRLFHASAWRKELCSP